MSKYSLLRYPKNPKIGPNWRARGDSFTFSIHSVANHQKLKGDRPFGENAKKLKGDPLVSSSFVCYYKKGTTLIVQFYFGHFQSVEKKTKKILTKSHDYSRRLKRTFPQKNFPAIFNTRSYLKPVYSSKNQQIAP